MLPRREGLDLPSVFDPTPPEDSQRPDDLLRIGTADREDALEKLNSALAEGRISDEEYWRRSGRVAGAVTRADLLGILADLPMGSIEQRIEARERAADREAVAQAQSAHQIRDRGAIANHLLHELGMQTFQLLNKRNGPKGVEILSVRYGIPLTKRYEPIRVQTGRVLMLVTSKAKNVGHGTWAVSEAGELFTLHPAGVWLRQSTVGRATLRSCCSREGFGGPVPQSGLKLDGPDKVFAPPGKKFERANDAFRSALAAAAKSAGGSVPIHALAPIVAYGEPNRHWDRVSESYQSCFYLGESGRLVYGSHECSSDPEELIAEMLY